MSFWDVLKTNHNSLSGAELVRLRLLAALKAVLLAFVTAILLLEALLAAVIGGDDAAGGTAGRGQK